MKRIHLFLSVCCLMSCVCPSSFPDTPSNPRLFFSEKDLPELSARIDLLELRVVWKDLIHRAEAFVTPGDDYYRNPEEVLAPVEEVADEERRMLQAGRHLAIWGETLGPAAYLTGEERYGRHGAALTVAMAEAYPFDAASHRGFMILSHGEMLRGLALGYDFFSPFMTAKERRLVAETTRDYLLHVLDQAREGVAWWYPASNHLAVAVGAAGCAALAIEPVFSDEAPQWIEGSRERVETWLDASFDEEGAYSEGASYIEYAMVNVALFSHALARNGGPEIFRHPKLAAAPRFIAMSLVPGTGKTEARNSAGFSPHFATPWMQRMARVNEDGLARWLWDLRAGTRDYPLVQLDHSPSRGISFFRILWHNDVKARSPEEAGVPLNQHFPGRGLCIWRTGWKEDDVMFSIEAGPFYNVTHKQSDQGHFNFYGYGHRWATDPGGDNRRVPESGAQAVAHSLVFVDGKAQAMSGSGTGTDGKITDYLETEDYSYALADATEAYNRNVAADERERKPDKGPDDLAAVVRYAHRHAFFIRPSPDALPYAVLIDDVQKDDRERLYTWQMVTYEEREVTFEDAAATLWPDAESRGEGAPRMRLYLAAGENEVSWVTDLHDFGIPRTPPRIRQIHANTRAVNPMFFTILVPVPAGGEAPEVVIENRGQSAIVRWPGRVDRIDWQGHGQRPRVRIE